MFYDGILLRFRNKINTYNMCFKVISEQYIDENKYVDLDIDIKDIENHVQT